MTYEDCEIMDGSLMRANCAKSEEPDAFCQQLVVALEGLKIRLQAQYERRFPGEGSRIREAIEDAETAAWRTSFPHLFLPDLVEEVVATRVKSSI
jgi:hypothetical protein